MEPECVMITKERPMTSKVIPVRVGADVEGDRERRPVRKDGLQQPNDLKHSPTASHHRHHGEERPSTRSGTLKTMLDTSVCTLDQSLTRLERCLSLAIFGQWLGDTVMVSPLLLLRIEKQSAQPGAESSAYRVTGRSLEHETLKLSTEGATFGKPPRQATSQLRRRVLIVVRVRENRTHGEGGQ